MLSPTVIIFYLNEVKQSLACRGPMTLTSGRERAEFGRPSGGEK